MKKATLHNLILAFAISLLLIPTTAAAAGDNSVNLGVAGAIGPDTTATLVFVEYERMLNNNLAILGRIGNLDYEYDDDVYLEEGDGPGLEVGVRVYPSGDGKGFYYGGAAGLWFTEWDWVDDQDDECTYTQGGVGACDLEAELGFYAVGAVTIGASF